jgi:hypothetical protein
LSGGKSRAARTKTFHWKNQKNISEQVIHAYSRKYLSLHLKWLKGHYNQDLKGKTYGITHNKLVLPGTGKHHRERKEVARS